MKELTPGKTMRFNPQAYAELGLKASSLLTSIIHALQKADATCIPKILIGVDSSIRYAFPELLFPSIWTAVTAVSARKYASSWVRAPRLPTRSPNFLGTSDKSWLNRRKTRSRDSSRKLKTSLFSFKCVDYFARYIYAHVSVQALCDMRLEVTTHMIPETVERIAWLRTNEAELGKPRLRLGTHD
jgi:hypothetical protein